MSEDFDDHLNNIANQVLMRVAPGKQHPWVVQAIAPRTLEMAEHYQGDADKLWSDLASFAFRPHAAACSALPEFMRLLIAVEESCIAAGDEDPDGLWSDLDEIAMQVRETLAKSMAAGGGLANE